MAGLTYSSRVIDLAKALLDHPINKETGLVKEIDVNLMPLLRQIDEIDINFTLLLLGIAKAKNNDQK